MVEDNTSQDPPVDEQHKDTVIDSVLNDPAKHAEILRKLGLPIPYPKWEGYKQRQSFTANMAPLSNVSSLEPDIWCEHASPSHGRIFLTTLIPFW